MATNQVKEVKPKKECITCKKPKIFGDFFLSNSEFHKSDGGRFPVCKACVKDNIDTDNIESIKDVLIQLNRPYLQRVWESSQDEVLKTKKDIFGTYYKNIILNDKTLTWKDSKFLNIASPNVENDTYIRSDNNIQSDDIVDKWGFGYTSDEYISFERKYNNLKNNYQEKTAMHTEALLTYIRYRVKEELATAQNDSKAAKEWGTLAKDAATAAKINPSQLSKSDLSDGLDTFGQLVRTVEQAIDIIPILPKFKEKPQDKADFTIWCYVNYVRDLKGLPPAEYKDIYEFYEVRKRAYEEAANQGVEDDII